MINFLPKRKERPNHNFAVVKKGLPKKHKYTAAAVVDFILIVLILITGIKPTSQLISPLASSFQSIYSQLNIKNTSQSFAFIPGQAPNKFDSVDLNNLSYLSFFDVPLTDDGQINKDSRGYGSFTSDETVSLFDRARSSKTKILLTLSALDEDRINYVLSHQDVQIELAKQAVTEIQNANIDGITIDFELPDGNGKNYQQRFNDFINLLTQTIHQQLPRAQVAVAVPSSDSKKNGLYDMATLSHVADKVLVIASDMIVPEEKNSSPSNPVYGYNQNDYFNALSGLLGNLLGKVPADKLVMERAWYGNGDNYPLYVPRTSAPIEADKEPAHVFMDQDTINRLAADVPAKGREAAKRNIPLIAKALDQEGILDSNVLAYALATVEHETDDSFEPLNEIQGPISARRLGYEGGMNYFGRGFIQLTHLRNYRNIGQRIGMGDQLAKHPELAGTPEVAAKILAAFFKDNNVANLASQGQFVAARRPINPDVNGWKVASLALKYEAD